MLDRGQAVTGEIERRNLDMREQFLRILSVIRVLSKETFVWCTGVIVGTVLLCMSFFTDQPVGREMTISSKIIQATENATAPDAYQTVIVNSVTNDILQLETKEASNDESDVVIAEDTLPDALVDEESDENEVGFSDTGIVSLDEYHALCKIVEAEASTQDLLGRTLVADVVLNRVESVKYPDSIKEVILDKGQFDPVTRGAYFGTDPDSLTKEAVMNALNGDNSSMGAIYFQKSMARVWGDKEYLFRYGDHSFYR